MPASMDSTSFRALSVSTMNRMSPTATISPSCLTHSARVPSSMVHPSWGITISTAIPVSYSAINSRTAAAITSGCGTTIASSTGL